MDYVVEEMSSFKVIGFEMKVKFENAYKEIPKFWGEFCDKCINNNYSEAEQKAIEECMIGEFGICIENEPNEKEFNYIIAGKYDGREVPEGMKVFEIPKLLWAKFRCVGPMPEALQTINTQIFKEWLPGNTTYALAERMNIEWYSGSDNSSMDYESGIWMPVRKL